VISGQIVDPTGWIHLYNLKATPGSCLVYPLFMTAQILSTANAYAPDIMRSERKQWQADPRQFHSGFFIILR